MAYVTGVNSGNLQVMPTAARMPALNYSALDLGDQNARIAGGLAIGRDISEYGKNRANELALKKAQIEAAQALANNAATEAQVARDTAAQRIASVNAKGARSTEEDKQGLQIDLDTAESKKAAAVAAANTARLINEQAERDAPTVAETSSLEAKLKHNAAEQEVSEIPLKNLLSQSSAEFQAKVADDFKKQGYSEVQGGKLVPGIKGPVFVADKLPTAVKVKDKPIKDEATGQWMQKVTINGEVSWDVVPGPKLDASAKPSKELEDFNMGGGANMKASIDQARAATLGGFPSGMSYNLAKNVSESPGTGIIGAAVKTVANKVVTADPVKENNKNVAISAGLGTMKQILGGQYSQKEGERIINNLLDPNLPEEIQQQRFNLFLDKLEAQYNAKKEYAEYFAKNGTTKGFSYKEPSMSDMESLAAEAANATKPAQGSQKGSSTTVVELNDNAKVVSGRPTAKKLSAPAYNSLDELTAAYKAGKITPEDARNLAISNGWAK